MVLTLYLYLIFMFFSSLYFLSALVKIKESEYIQFRKDTYVLLINLNEMFDIADDVLIENLDLKTINNRLLEN